MHPIERLRYVARASGVDQSLLVQETASALGAFGADPAGMVTACRRVVGRHPAAGALWWLCGRVLTANDPMPEAWRAADEIDADRTAAELSFALPEDASVCLLGWPDVAVARNAWGRQVDSFTAKDDAERLPLVFIRAPRVVAVGPQVEILATFQGEPILCRQGRLYGATFHPELTADRSVHQAVFGPS